MKPLIKIKRAYEKPTKEDGIRILVDRLWPRGFTKEKVAIKEWAKALAPTPELREWFGHSITMPSSYNSTCSIRSNNPKK